MISPLRVAALAALKRTESAFSSLASRRVSSNSIGGSASFRSSAKSTTAPMVRAANFSSSAVAAMGSTSAPQARPSPFAPTSAQVKRKFLPRRMAHLLQILEAEAEAASTAARAGSASLNSSPSTAAAAAASSSSSTATSTSSSANALPQIRPGDVIEAKLAVPENRGRVSTIRGVCIALRRRGWRSSIALLKHVPGGGSVERLLPLHSPLLRDVKVVEAATTTAAAAKKSAGGGNHNAKGPRRVRRAKLYYLRDRNPKEYRV